MENRDPTFSPDDGTAATALPGAGAGIGLAVLSQDDTLLETLGEVVTSDHAIILCDGESALAEAVMTGKCGVALIDAAAVPGSVAQLTSRLRQQFPDLVLVAAGGVEQQGQLATQITSGDVYRFLHKPVSAQRVRLFVQAALRRHDEEYAAARQQRDATGRTMPEDGPAAGLRPASGSQPPLRITAIALGLLLVAGAAWLMLRDRGAASNAGASDAPAAAANRRDAAPGAAPDAATSRLLDQAEKAIVDGRLDDAAGDLDAARALQPDNVRIAFLATQLGKERERVLLARARAAAASGDLGTALAVLGSPTEGDAQPGASLVAEERRALEARQVEERVRALLRLSRQRLRSGSLTEPASDNARFYLESARALAPRDAAVARLSSQLAERSLADARAAVARGDAPAAIRALRIAADLGVPARELDPLRSQVTSMQGTARAAEVGRLAALVAQRIGQGRLVEPGNDGAKSHFMALLATEPDGPTVAALRQTLGRAMLGESRDAIVRGDLPAAQRWLAEAESIGLPASETAAVGTDLAAARDELARGTQVVGIGALKRIRAVEPTYPREAKTGGVTGWVELEFTVNTRGGVKDIRVTASQPAAVFDTAAVEALGKWRFEPVRRDGAAVEQRARLRMRFEVD